MGAIERDGPAATVDDRFESRRLERVFDACFYLRWRTRLVGGAPEPFYQPAGRDGTCHQLHYRSDYFASALHEVAHWCIAGEARRRLPDFGYWYAPDGRTAGQQAAFESVEYRPQALEWFFSRACAHRFRVSADNLHPDGSIPDGESFKRRVLDQALHWQTAGLPLRAGMFFAALSNEFGTRLQVAQLRFSLAELC